MRKALLLMILLLIPSAIGLTTDKDLYIAGQSINVDTGGEALIIETPTGSYRQLGVSKSITYPTSVPGEYTFITNSETLTVRALEPMEISLWTAKGRSRMQAGRDGNGLHMELPGFEKVKLHDTSTTEIRITPDLGSRWGFERTYAVDPAVPGFGTAELTLIATGEELYKCAQYDYFTQTCKGTWSFQRTLTPGEPYTINVTGADPAFGEGDSESSPDSCAFSDETGQGDGDSNTGCLTEVQTQDSGITADLQDLEGSGATSQIDIGFANSLPIASVNSANVTYRYQRASNSEVGATTATIEVMDGGAWTMACTDTVSIGGWESYTCDLSTYITTEAEANNVQTRILFSTAQQSRPSSTGTVYVDYSYYSLDYVYDDRIAPVYSNVQASPPSPHTYDGTSSDFSVDWSDDVALQTVQIEHNFSGSTQSEPVSGGPTYTHSQTLPAGTYQWRQTANDTSSNTNTTPWQSYTVNKATGSVRLELEGTRGDLTIDEDSTINLTGTREAGETTMSLTEDGATIASGSAISIERTYNEPGTYELNLSIPSSHNYTSDWESWTLTVKDTTPPAAVTNLANESAAESWIRWTWNNPADADYSHAIVEVNGSFVANVTTPYHNVTGLSADTQYQISVRTVDTSDNINQSAQTDLARTLQSFDNTPPLISNVQSSGITDSSADITWATDENSDSLVKYGTTSESYTLTALESEDVTSHNVTLTDLSPSTTYYYVVNSTDPAGNTAQSAQNQFTTTNDVTPPRYSSIRSSPASGSAYPVTAEFNVTWSDNGMIDTVLIEHNFTGEWQNETMNAGSEYTYSRSLGAGTYAWRSLANDTQGNLNDTMSLQTYTVQRAIGQVNLLLEGLDGDTSKDEDLDVNITGERIAGEGDLRILENGTEHSSGAPPLTHIKNYTQPGTYNITAEMDETQNYTYASESHTLTINDTTPPAVNLVEPFDGKTNVDGEVTFSYTVDDNVATTSCTLYIDSAENQTNTSITDGATNYFHQTLPDGNYTWTVGCSDDEGNKLNATSRNLRVDIIHAWIPTTAVSSDGATITGTINQSDGTTQSLNTGQYAEVTAWSETAPTNANITAVTGSCEVDSASRGARYFFQYNTGSGWSGDICGQPQDSTGTFDCDLFAQGVDTVNELNALDLRCVVRDNDGGPGARSELDYTQVQPEWMLIEEPDIRVTRQNLTFSSQAAEGDIVTLSVKVENIGAVGASPKVEFYDSTRERSIQNITKSIAAGDWEWFNATWTATIGPTNISVVADPENLIGEIAESNNNASKTINVSAWQTYYGSTIQRFLALGTEGNNLQYNWSNENLVGNIYAMDADAGVSMLDVQALTRTATDAYSFADLHSADLHLAMDGLADSINRTFSRTGSLMGTSSFNVSGVTINDVPTINSTNTSSFITGILWDVSDDTNGLYDGEEDLIFVTQVNLSRQGSFGVYDYELRIPAFLRDDRTGVSEVSLFLELS